MKTIAALMLLAVLGAPVMAETVLIRAGGYVDVDRGRLVTPAVVLVEDGLISSVNPRREPNADRSIDLGDSILLPGLMDMHVHLDFDFTGANFGVVVKESGSEGALRGAKNAELALMAGFTTVRSAGQVHPTPDLIDVALASASELGWIKAPRIVPVGHMISILGGHGDLSMAEGLSEGMLELDPARGVVSGVDEAVRATRYQIKHGAKTIKIHATAGVLSLEESVGAQQLTDEEMRAVVAEAHRHDIPVAAHAHGTQGIKAAIRAGVDSIEHGSMLDDEAIRLLVENKVVLVPTSGLMDLLDPAKLPPLKRTKAEYVMPIAKESLSKAIKAGVKVAIGTDAPIIPHGKNAYEVTVMVDRGMTPAEALRSATIVPAELIRIDNLGQIKEGMLADLIAVAANPLDDIGALENVSFVMKAGQVYKLDQ